jgi:TRAP-type uncharacterized transport system fused permease subunit
MFVFGQSLLLEGTLWEIVTTIISGLVGVFVLAIGIEGYWQSYLSYLWRLLALAAAVLLIFPGIKTDSLGLALVLLIVFRNKVAPTKAGR